MSPEGKNIFIDKTGKPRATIQDRRAKGFGIVSQIIAITNEAPLGKWRIKSGILLRNAMLVNSMLFNAEAWQGISVEDIESMSRVDEALLRGLLSAHSKTPKEALFLETGLIPLKYIVTSRRLMYLQTILKRKKDEVTRKIYEAQKLNPSKGDFIELIKADKGIVSLELSDNEIENMERHTYQNIIRKKVRSAAFLYLQSLQKIQSKTRSCWQWTGMVPSMRTCSCPQWTDRGWQSCSSAPCCRPGTGY